MTEVQRGFNKSPSGERILSGKKLGRFQNLDMCVDPNGWIRKGRKCQAQGAAGEKTPK